MNGTTAAPGPSLARLLRPRSVAIIGASANPRSPAYAALANLTKFGYAGAIHLVSAKAAGIEGRPCVATIADLPQGIDAAILLVPQDAVLEAVRACIQRQIGGLVVVASGFAESGAAGRELQDQLRDMVQPASLLMLGPNCMGFANFVDGVALNFSGSVAPVTFASRPAIGILAQSGAMATHLQLGVRAKGAAVSYVVSTGNEAAIGLEDLIAYLIDDSATQVIAVFAETIRNPQRFLELAATAKRCGKPIVLMHTGHSAPARAASLTHTGAVAGDYATMRLLVEEAGVVFVDSTEALIDAVTMLNHYPQPRSGGLAVLTNSGAFRAIALDACDALDLRLPPLTSAAQAAFAAALPGFADAANPLDLTVQSTRDTSIYATGARILAEEPDVATLLVGLVPGSPAQQMARAPHLLPALAAIAKPTALLMLGDEWPLAPEFETAVRAQGLTIFRSPMRAFQALAHLTAYGRSLARTKAPPVHVAFDVPDPLPQLCEYQAKAVLRSGGLRVPEGRLAIDVNDAVQVAAEIGYPVALKAQAASLLHKTEAGGVTIRMADEATLRQAWSRTLDALAKVRPGLSLDGMLVEQMAPGGIEVFIGMRRDPLWGGVLALGLGGIWVEALRDVQLFPLDASEAEIVAGLDRLSGAALLRGARGSPPRDIPALARAARIIAALARQHPEIAEIDVNPIVVYPTGQGILCLDALLVPGQAAPDQGRPVEPSRVRAPRTEKAPL